MRYQAFLISALTLLLVLGCAESEESTNPVTQGTTSCPIHFTGQNLCAEIEWKKGPVQNATSEYEVRFWRKDTGTATGPWVTPNGTLKAFTRMTCCGSTFDSIATEVSTGRYSVNQVNFTGGPEWEVYLRLEADGVSENQFVVVKFDE